MRWIVVATALLCAGQAGSAQAPDASSAEKQRLIRRMLEVTNTTENMLAVMETALPQQRAMNPNIPPAFWDRFAKLIRERSGKLVDSLVPIYDRSFSTADLREIIRFYESPIGKRMVAAVPTITRESMLVGQRWGAAIGQEVGEQMQREGLAPQRPPE